MPELNNNVTVNVSTDNPPVSAANFGVPLYLPTPGTLGVGFTERIRFYTDTDGVAADLASGDITASVADALEIALQQTPRVTTLAVGRVDAGTTEEKTLTITAVTADDVVTAWLDGHKVEHTVTGIDDVDSVALALDALLSALPNAAKFDISNATNVITIFRLIGSVPFDLVVETTGTSTAAVATSSPAPDATIDLDAILAENGGFYAVISEDKGDGWHKLVSAWAETNRRLYFAQSNTPGVKGSDTDDLLSVLGGLAREFTVITQHASDTDEQSEAWPAKKLEANPDVKTTAWAYATLAGITPGTFTQTERQNLEGKNGNLYWLFYGFGSMWPGVTCAGRKIDVRISLDWTKARIEEGLAQLFLTVYNANSKIPLTDEGISQGAAVIKSVGRQGEVAGHYVEGTFVVTQPLASEVLGPDRDARTVRYEFTAQLAGAIEKTFVNGFVSTTLPG